MTPKQYQAIKACLAHFPEVTQVKIFGSRAMGTYRPNSDIDLALYGNIPDRLLNHIAYTLDHDVPVPFEFDVVHYETLAHENMKQHINTEGKIF